MNNNQTHSLWKFAEDTKLQTWMVVYYEWKFFKNRTKSMDTTCRFIWHVNRSECVQWLETDFMKVWLRYMLSNTNAAIFCVIFSEIGPCSRQTQKAV